MVVSNAQNAPRASTLSGALSACRGAFFGVGAVSLVINLLMLTGPMFMLQVYDRVLASRSVPTLIVLAGLAGALYVFFGLLEDLRGRSLLRIGQRLDTQLSGASFAAAVNLPVALGRRGARLDPVRDLELVRQFLTGAGPAALFDLPWMPLYLAIVFLLHPYLGFLALGGATFIIALLVLNEATSRKPTQELAGLNGQKVTTLTSVRRNGEVVSAMGMLETLTNRWNAGNQRFLSRQQRASDRALMFASITKAFRFLLQSAVLGLGAWLVIRQEMSSGGMIAASIITSRALAPVEQAVAHWRGFVGARQARRRLDEVPRAETHTPETELPAPHRDLKVEALMVAAPGETTALIQGASFRLAAGDGLGVIGPSGSGKTSLLRALVGVWPTSRGAVRLDGSELNQWTRTALGASIGYLPQDVELFEGTIAENIARFEPEPASEAVLEAARLAGVHDLVAGMDKGYDTQIGEAGARLSAGQRQRIGLARALYRSPFLIALDEPNSNLDAEGDAALTQAIKAMREKGSIVIVVAHRPSALAAVDTVLLMKDGRQAAFGPKQEVLDQLQKAQTQPQPQAPAGSLKVVPQHA
ncbi:PrtD family type I secretion system ABC transporter [Breoghania corrubedonensis]|uniref:PrtD family type I secretion system ABC transporter n=1 Tax=Breoghania corrubedonensis TaxID=665038 RepID=A0A2T5VFX4_9HYPH|nr:type I secretion system permease/ATPase [Breoghania corrubedonensis]PTW62651.1 PrtD family type I secretion system ABC transporter [Breoghania corrubedonensis]